MHATAGILLSNDLFRQEWFWYLGAFVAFNTLVFAGLTLGKAIPWPRPASAVTIEEWRERMSEAGGPAASPRTDVHADEDA